MAPTLKVGLLSLVFAGGFLWMGRGSVPPPEVLQEASGQLVAIHKDIGKGNKLSALRIELDDGSAFEYSHKAGEIEAVAGALSRADRAPVTVRYAERANDLPYAYEIAIGTRPLRTYAAVSAAWARTNRNARLAALGAAVFGAGCLVAFFLQRKPT